MKKSLKKYVELLEKDNNYQTKDNILINIKFYQHERLIHFLVVFLTGIYMILFFLSFLLLENILLFILFLITLFLFIPYILYYYYLENNIQKLYEIYNKK